MVNDKGLAILMNVAMANERPCFKDSGDYSSKSMSFMTIRNLKL
jgi:hypothetical protein